MALIKCKECGKEFSDTSNVCPSCGYTRKKQVGCLTIFLVGLGLYLLLALIINLELNNSGQVQKNQISKQSENLKVFPGYQNINFGMNKEQVKQLFDGRLIKSKEKYLEYIKDKSEITFWFFNNALYQIDVNPNTKGKNRNVSAQDDIANLINAMSMKYGDYKKIPNMLRGYDLIKQSVEYYMWTFKDNKEIVLSYLDLIKNDIPMELVWESLEISYRDLDLIRKKDLYELQEKQNELQKSAKQKQNELEGVI